jgi:hypothetical protein
MLCSKNGIVGAVRGPRLGGRCNTTGFGFLSSMVVVVFFKDFVALRGFIFLPCFVY